MEIVRGNIDLDLALRIQKPTSFTHFSTFNEMRDYEKYDRSNCMSQIIIKHVILEVFKDIVFEEITRAKYFLTEIEKCFTKKKVIM